MKINKLKKGDVVTFDSPENIGCRWSEVLKIEGDKVQLSYRLWFYIWNTGFKGMNITGRVSRIMIVVHYRGERMKLNISIKSYYPIDYKNIEVLKI